VNTYEYVAVGADGASVRGRTSARDELELDRELEGRGLVLATARVVLAQQRVRRSRVAHNDLIALTTQLATVTSAGVHIVEGLEGIGKRLSRPASRAVVEDLVRSLRSGSMLSEALERHPQSFPSVYRASVRAGEASGALETVLLKLAKHLEWTRGIRATAAQALIYPAILMFALAGLVAILLYFVLPRILTLFPGGRAELPPETRWVVAASDFLVGNIVWLLLLAAAGVTSFVFARRNPRGRAALDQALLQAPLFGRIAQQIAVSRFAATASVLQQAGCDVFTVLNVAGATCGNAALGAAFTRVCERVRRGQTITQGLEQEPRLDGMLVQMVAVGEKTGELDRCLERLSDFYDEEIPRAVKRFLAVLEPGMLLVAGLVVGAILLAVLAPIFKLYESIG
jgi:type II secretory pathway component PulF